MCSRVDFEEQLRTQARRIYGRYAEEVIEAHGFCPWAADARKRGEVSLQIVLGEHPSPDAVADLTQTLADNAQAIIGLLVFPQLPLEALPFQHFAASVRERLDERYVRGACPWAIADFHPHGARDLASPERAVAFVRRSPDPTLQLVRKSTLAELRRKEGEGTAFIDPSTIDLSNLSSLQGASVPLSERVAQNNYKKLQRVVDAVESTLENIALDRARSYSAVPLPTPHW